MKDKPIKVTDDSFEQEVLQADLPVLVDFWAPWCGPCHMIAPALEQLAQAYAGKIVVAKVDTDENLQYATEFGVRGIPNMIIFLAGQPVERIVGAVPYPYLQGRVENVLAQKNLETP